MALTWVNLLAFVLFFSGTAEAQRKPWESNPWLSLFQDGDINSDRYYLSGNAKATPEEEYQASLKAFNDTSRLWGTQALPAACIFPARKIIVEKLSGTRFPSVKCPDLDEWIKGIDADQVKLVFAGAYSGNPASILGHTFLRFYNKRTENQRGSDLLGYSVGFLALPDPSDNRMLYILKGLTGGYPGYFDIEPFYMKVGLYNNSESRDLWEWKLRLNEDEVRFMLLHLWELAFNAQFDYFFIDENCSHRLLKLIAVLRAEVAGQAAAIDSELGAIVIPGETVRSAARLGLIDREARFRSSLERKNRYQISKMNPGQLSLYRRGRSDLFAVREIQDPLVLDALIDQWTLTNFKERTNLSTTQKSLMDATLNRRAELSVKSMAPTDSEIESHYGLTPLLESHQPHWALGALNPEVQAEEFRLSFRSGYHPLWGNSRGMDDISEIEYLGADFRRSQGANQVDLWLIRVKSLEALAWQFEVGATNHCATCFDIREGQEQGLLSGGVGTSLNFGAQKFFLMALGEGRGWVHHGAQLALIPGAGAGMLLDWRWGKLLTDYEHYWWKENQSAELTATLSFFMTKDLNFVSEFKNLKSAEDRSSHSFTTGVAYFF